MAHSFVSCLMHCVFSTKNREKTIDDELALRLWPYMGGIARENKMSALEVGGYYDHIHILLSIPSTMTTAKALQLIKGGSSKWIHETFANRRSFAWQEGYGAFSIGITGVDDTVNYIRDQKKHHSKASFKTEFIGFLKKHNMDHKDPWLWT
jgi:REP element-mobilizing transposase RayT